MIHNVLSYLEFHIVDLAGGLSPLIPEFVGELHTLCHFLVSKLGECVSDQSWIVPLTDETLESLCCVLLLNHFVSSIDLS